MMTSRCDVRSHVVSKYVGGGSAEIEDVVRAGVRARPLYRFRTRHTSYPGSTNATVPLMPSAPSRPSRSARSGCTATTATSESRN